MKKIKKEVKVIYAEVRPDIVKTLEKLCEKLDLPKNRVISKAIENLAIEALVKNK
jgi:predicted transcriptional regulator